jgi:hypothetical protein
LVGLLIAWGALALQIIIILNKLGDYLPVKIQNRGDQEIKYNLEFVVINLIDCPCRRQGQSAPRIVVIKHI